MRHQTGEPPALETAGTPVDRSFQPSPLKSPEQQSANVISPDVECGVIFIYEAIKSLVNVFQNRDVQMDHDTALLSLLLALGTFYIAISLSRFRRSGYLRPRIREFIADFGLRLQLRP